MTTQASYSRMLRPVWTELWPPGPIIYECCVLSEHVLVEQLGTSWITGEAAERFIQEEKYNYTPLRVPEEGGKRGV